MQSTTPNSKFSLSLRVLLEGTIEMTGIPCVKLQFFNLLQIPNDFLMSDDWKLTSISDGVHRKAVSIALLSLSACTKL